MRRLVKAFSDWRSRIGEFTPEQWAVIRAKGRGRFVLRQMFPYTVYMIALYDVFTQLGHHGQPFEFGSYIFQAAVCGIFVGYGVWGDQEAKYKKALKSSSQTSVQPH